MISRDFCAKITTSNNLTIVILLEVVVKENKFGWNDNSKISNVTITPVAILVIRDVKNSSKVFQFGKIEILQTELRDILKDKINKLINS